MAVTTYLGDCRQVIPDIGKFQLIFADPPFGIGQAYDGFDDRNVEPMIREAIAAMWDACDGVLCLHGPDSLAELYLEEAKRHGMRRIAWCLWHYRFGQCGRGNWIHGHEHLLVFGKHKTNTWNPEAVLVESDRATTYGDKRIHETENGGKRVPFTVWGIPSDGPYWGRVQGNSKERRGKHPNQLPEKYAERIVLAYSNPGDRVLDPFAGSGTFPVVASALGRDAYAIDISQPNCDSIVFRAARGPIRIEPTTPAGVTP